MTQKGKLSVNTFNLRLALSPTSSRGVMFHVSLTNVLTIFQITITDIYT